MLPGISWQDDPPERLLVERFHIISGFHPEQRDIIEKLVEGKRVLAIQRTGWGKSLCYQMASLYYPHITIVFSPLKALMRDQCLRCNNTYSIPSAIVSSEFNEQENRITLERAVHGDFKILFIAPERLNNLDWQISVTRMRISMIVIDEAHCISIWGHDFRRDYRRIIRLVEAIPEKTPLLALTATANQRVEADILQQICAAQIVRGSMQRSNLSLNVVRLQDNQDKLEYLAEILPQLSGTGIIYTATRTDAEMVAAFLNTQHIHSAYYHAGLEDSVRQTLEQEWMNNNYKVICATNALGMGIDKPDIRFVFHYQITASPINYYQEIGRAGRDGEHALCILLYDPADMLIQEYFIQTAKPTKAQCLAILTCLHVKPSGLYDLMRETGLPQKVIQSVLADLEEQSIIERNKNKKYTASTFSRELDFSANEANRLQKENELQDIQTYATKTDICYMGFLTTYLGDQPGYLCGTCGHCHKGNFPLIAPQKGIQLAVAQFLNENFLPPIEKRGNDKNPVYEAGWSLSYHGNSPIGKLVSVSKYNNAGPFKEDLIHHAVKVINSHYPVDRISGIISVPPTKSGKLVEMFARSIAGMLHIDYMHVLTKIRSTDEQKNCTNWLQKAENVKDAFKVSSPTLITGRSLLLIDDIYDSGHTIREVGRTLMLAGAQAVYPFTITRTLHSDNQ